MLASLLLQIYLLVSYSFRFIKPFILFAFSINVKIHTLKIISDFYEIFHESGLSKIEGTFCSFQRMKVTIGVVE